MNSSVRVIAVCVGVAAGIALAAATLQARERWFPRAASEQRFVVSHEWPGGRPPVTVIDSVVSDVYWIRTCSTTRRSASPSVLADGIRAPIPAPGLTTTLDPHFAVAYQFAQSFSPKLRRWRGAT